REESRDAWGWSWLDHALRDLRHALRLLARTPGFTAVAIATLAIGIGGTTAMFTIVDRVLLAPLPYPDPGRLVTFRYYESLPDLHDIRARSRALVKAGGVTMQALDYTGEAEPVQVQAGLVTTDLFAALGARPALGRLLTPDEQVPGGARAVVLGDR